jgi:hypothetical protein
MEGQANACSFSIGNARLAGLEADLNMSGGDYALALSESSSNDVGGSH